MYQEIERQTREAVEELLSVARLREGDVFVVGCSTSEVAGQKIGTGSTPEIAAAILRGLYPPLKERGLYLAAQCCEHLNRALILERAAAERYRLEQVNAVPQLHAGGAFAMAVRAALDDPVAVEELHVARAGMDIGNTLIGMHLARVAIPVRVGVRRIGEAALVCARVRPKYVGGERAAYDPALR